MLTLKAHAKINWFLRVTGKRADGFHEIESLFQRVSLRDELTFEEASSLSVVTEAAIPSDDNLVIKAALKLRETAGVTKGARLGLIKNIPIAAGLGGGSSDAAVTLTGLNNLWELGFPDERLGEMAAELGSDVPFFLGGPSALATGRGEKLSLVDSGKSVALLLLNPGIGVSAGWAYSNLQGFSEEDSGYADSFLQNLVSGDWAALREMAVNDLEAPVVKKHPVVGELKAALIETGALYAAMSGSGPTVFGIFPDTEAAKRASETIKSPWSAVAETLA
jgi:4-diphosphocytidyl-2-C-methyl-D-erythritol kinase